MTWPFWIVLFSTSCLSNLLGLNISSAFDSVKTIYILIPFILIPQLLFSGVIVNFDRLNRSSFSSREYVPIIGELMAARWSFEALAVEQFRNNLYERNFFEYDLERSRNQWYSDFLINHLKEYLYQCKVYNDSIQYREYLHGNYVKLNYYIDVLSREAGSDFIPGEWKSSLNEDGFNTEVANQAEDYLANLQDHFRSVRKKYTGLLDSVEVSLSNELGENGLIRLKDDNYNSSLEDLVLDRTAVEAYIETDDRIIQKYEPLYMKPVSKIGRAQYFAAYKQVGNTRVNTFWFNILVLWFTTFMLYITLYYELLKKAVNIFQFIRNAYIRRKSAVDFSKINPG